MVTVVADTTPLLYLARLGQLDVLARLYGEVLVPSAVWDELVLRRPDARGVSALRSASWLCVDDGAGRALARRRGLVPRGTLAILVDARRAGFLPALAPVLDALAVEGFRMSAPLRAWALQAVGEAPAER